MNPISRTLAALAALVLVASPSPAPAAGGFGPTGPSQDLEALIALDPAIETALLASFEKADWNGIATMADFYAYIDRIVRMVPTRENLLGEIRPLFFLIGQSDYLDNSPAFHDWVKRTVATYGRFLDTPQSITGIESYFKDPAFKLDDYIVGPSGWLTFNQFFARQVKPGKRPIAGLGDRTTLVAPADGLFRGQFEVGDEAAITVKGIEYTIADLLAGSAYADAFAGGLFTHSYQSITDYHRFHVPFAGKVVEAKNVAGYVWLNLEQADDGSFVSVDGTGFQWRQERGVLVLETEEIGLVALIPVGMGFVGDAVLTPDVGAMLHKGEEFGFFQFGGSDVIMVFQKDRVRIDAEVGRHYLQGEAIGTRLGSP